MKEFIIKVPEDADEVIAAVMEKFGVESVALKKRKAI